MKILVTGANGFVGKNLISTLETIRDGKNRSTDLPTDLEILPYDIGTPDELFEQYCRECDFVYNLVGVHRPKDDSEFMTGNYGFVSTLLDTLERVGNSPRIAFSSSVQAELNNPYGESKRAAENAIFDYSERTGAKVYIFRFTNIFGKWSRPNYNSVVATFCYNIANDLPISIRDRNYEMKLVYIDDVVNQMLEVLMDRGIKCGDFYAVPEFHNVTLGELADMIYSFKESRNNRFIPDMTEGSFSKKLYSTYLSYLPKDGFSYPLNQNTDERGSFTEVLKTENFGQVSVNISKPHITKGEHWHHTKNEKFLVVHGKGVIRFRKIDSDEIIEYYVSGDKLEVVDIPTGYTHNIENLGDDDMVTLMWANECFNPDRPDTFALKVKE
ncbi:MAG: SDR family oxidoreductase [Ruminococcaceae bacterium]|nr:SDR family oxidoreductase [Oscillospiraceae bacterium]